MWSLMPIIKSEVVLAQSLKFSAAKIFPDDTMKLLLSHFPNSSLHLGIFSGLHWAEGWHLYWFAPKLPATCIDRSRCQQGETNKLILLDDLSQMWIEVSRKKEKGRKIWPLPAMPYSFCFLQDYQPWTFPMKSFWNSDSRLSGLEYLRTNVSPFATTLFDNIKYNKQFALDDVSFNYQNNPMWHVLSFPLFRCRMWVQERQKLLPKLTRLTDQN